MRKRIGAVLAATLLLLGSAALSGEAWAHGRSHFGHRHHGARLGVFIGVPLGYWAAPRYYYPPAVVAVPSGPPVYIERGIDETVESGNWWYHCSDPEGYYPYVKDCRSGWKRVSPTPPPG